MKVQVRKISALRMAGGAWDNKVEAIEVQYVVPLDSVKLYTFPRALEELGIREEVEEVRMLEEGRSRKEVHEIEEKLNRLLSRYLQKVDIEIVEEASDVIKPSEPLPEGSIRLEDRGYYIILAREAKDEIKKLLEEVRLEKVRNEIKDENSDSLSAQERLIRAIAGENAKDPIPIKLNTVIKNPGYAEIPRGFRVIRFAPDLVAVVPEGQSIVTLSCSKNLMGRVIGKSGQTIRSVQEKYKIRINLKEA